MNLDERGRRAAGEIRRAVGAPEPLGTWTPIRSSGSSGRVGPVERSAHRERRLLALAIFVGAMAVVGATPADDRAPATGPPRRDPVRRVGPAGFARPLVHDRNGWFARKDLGIDASCAVVPRRRPGSSSRTTPGSPRRARPPSGHRTRRLEPPPARRGRRPGPEPRLRQRVAGRTRIALEGFVARTTGEAGSIRCARPMEATWFGSPPGSTDRPPTRPTVAVVFFAHQTRHPSRWSGGALRRGRRRQASNPSRPGAPFLDNAWSPDGEWICSSALTESCSSCIPTAAACIASPWSCRAWGLNSIMVA